MGQGNKNVSYAANYKRLVNKLFLLYNLLLILCKLFYLYYIIVYCFCGHASFTAPQTTKIIIFTKDIIILLYLEAYRSTVVYVIIIYKA